MYSRHLLYRRIALIMSLLMFVSSVGFSLSIGHCNTMAMGEGLENVQSCMQLSESGVKECPPGCCDTELVVITGLDYNYVTTATVSFNELDFLILVPIFNFTMEENDESISTPIKFLNLKPPLPKQDVRILYQSFLL